MTDGGPSAQDVASFYRGFTDRQASNYVHGNARVSLQLAFLADAVPAGTRSVLVIGCGLGEACDALARRIARSARIVGLDLNGRAIALARKLHAHPRVEHVHADALAWDTDTTWDVIVLPDVYEHVAIASRPAFHARLAALLSPQGRLLLTLPSPEHQAQVALRGELQVIDEVVTLDDLQTLARDVRGRVTHASCVSAWRVDDYVHAVIERAPAGGEPSRDDHLPLKRRRPPRARVMAAALAPFERVRHAIVVRFRKARLRRAAGGQLEL